MESRVVLYLFVRPLLAMSVMITNGSSSKQASNGHGSSTFSGGMVTSCGVLNEEEMVVVMVGLFGATQMGWS